MLSPGYVAEESSRVCTLQDTRCLKKYSREYRFQGVLSQSVTHTFLEYDTPRWPLRNLEFYSYASAYVQLCHHSYQCQDEISHSVFLFTKSHPILM